MDDYCYNIKLYSQQPSIQQQYEININIHQMQSFSSSPTLIEEMTNMLIRPQRELYTVEQLGSKEMVVKSKDGYVEVKRRDVCILVNGMKVLLSVYLPQQPKSKHQYEHQHEHSHQHSHSHQQQYKTTTHQHRREHMYESRRMPNCMIYLHANNGSRMEALEYIKYILQFNWMVITFDCRGSGISEGEWTTMGVKQAEDLGAIMRWAKTGYKIDKFGLWGRSMGAVTILYYLTKHYQKDYHQHSVTISSVVLDSPFCSLQKLMSELATSKTSLPQFIFTPLIASISQKVFSKTSLSLLNELNLISRMNCIHQSNNVDLLSLISGIRGMFLASKEDKLVQWGHVEEIRKVFQFQGGEVVQVGKGHNEPRQEWVKLKCAKFICQNGKKMIMKTQEKKQVESPYFYNNSVLTEDTKLNDYGDRLILRGQKMIERGQKFFNNANHLNYQPHANSHSNHRSHLPTSKSYIASSKHTSQQHIQSFTKINEYPMQINFVGSNYVPSNPYQIAQKNNQPLIVINNNYNVEVKVEGGKTSREAKGQIKVNVPVPVNVQVPVQQVPTQPVPKLNFQYMEEKECEPPKESLSRRYTDFSSNPTSIFTSKEKIFGESSFAKPKPRDSNTSNHSAKLSLTEIRRKQKQEQEKCQMSISKIISSTPPPSPLQNHQMQYRTERQLNGNQHNGHQQKEGHKTNTGSKTQIRMKTSLISKGKGRTSNQAGKNFDFA